MLTQVYAECIPLDDGSGYLCFDTNDNRVILGSFNPAPNTLPRGFAGSNWLTHSSQCQLFFSNNKLFANFIISPGMNESPNIPWNWGPDNANFRRDTINLDMFPIYQATKAKPNGEAILTANLYMKTNITYSLINLTNSPYTVHSENKIIYITPEGNKIIPPPIPDSFANGEYTWNFSAIPIDLKCEFDNPQDGILDNNEVSGVTNQFLATVSKTANIELVKKNDEEKFRDDKTKKRDIISRNVTTGDLKVNDEVDVQEYKKVDIIVS